MSDLTTSPNTNRPAVVSPVPSTLTELSITRRRLLITSFWASIGALVTGLVATILNTVFPRDVGGFGGPITVPANRIPAPGADPKPILEGRFLLVNLAPGQGSPPDSEAQTSGGLLALYRKCPHLGCTVPWRPDANFKDIRGVFLCPCHQSTYTRAGVCVFGPAPRSMDTMAVEVLDTGDIVVQTGQITQGDSNNPLRAIPYGSPSS
jgi:cytochrome b6-f complex iron-sulfur subunit